MYVLRHPYVRAYGIIKRSRAQTAGVVRDTYLATLEAMGIAVDDPAPAIAMGKSVCARLDQGAGVSIAAYCDHHKGLIGR